MGRWRWIGFHFDYVAHRKGVANPGGYKLESFPFLLRLLTYESSNNGRFSACEENSIKRSSYFTENPITLSISISCVFIA